MKKYTLKSLEDIPLLAVSYESMEWNKTGSWRHVRPIYVEKIAPCRKGCPAAEPIPEYFSFAKEGKYLEAWKLIMEENPFPGVCGRVCYHPCENKCNRREFDDPIAIHLMERFIADQIYGQRIKIPLIEDKKDKKIAIVGSGPAGLSCAYQLARRGYKITIYEAYSELGGMLRLGIPKYRLPREVLDYEIRNILELGIEVKTNTKIGLDITLNELNKKYDAIFIAVGAHRSKKLGIEKEDLDNIRSGLDFLKDINAGKETFIGKKVIVIGGGNTAIDAARTSLRLGASVSIYYRRTRLEMPAVPEEIRAAEQEGVNFQFLVAPVRAIGEKGKVKAMEFIKMQLGEKDASGRRAPVPIPNSNFIVETDFVLKAIGEDPELEFAEKDLLEGMRIKVNEAQASLKDKIFAGGDCATNPLGTVVDAIATGKKAAYAIHKYFGYKVPEINFDDIVEYDDLNIIYFSNAARIKNEELKVEKRIKNFLEVNKGLSVNEALEEVLRCFSCGYCTYCDNCYVFCPDGAIKKKSGGKGYIIDYDHCKGCGICWEECPRSSISLIKEIEVKNESK